MQFCILPVIQPGHRIQLDALLQNSASLQSLFCKISKRLRVIFPLLLVNIWHRLVNTVNHQFPIGFSVHRCRNSRIHIDDHLFSLSIRLTGLKLPIYHTCIFRNLLRLKPLPLDRKLNPAGFFLILLQPL